MQKIRMVDLQGQYLRIKPEIDSAIQSVLTSTEFIQGPAVKEFEKVFSEYHAGTNVVACANGTDALQVAMMALGFKTGDEVILPVFTYVATAEVIALLGLKPVFADVDERTFAIDLSQLESKITSRTVAIVPVHLFGQCAPMEALLAIARKHDLLVIEDFAQAIGSTYTLSGGISKKAGTMGAIGCTSFFPSKNLGCYGDGGAILTNDNSLAETVRMVANHGQRVKYHHDAVGVNSRLDSLQAAVLNVKLRYLGEYEEQRRRAADYYDHALGDVSFLSIPFRAPYSTHVFHQYTIKVKNDRRGELKKFLESRGVPSMIYYPLPLHFQEAYKIKGIGPGSFPVSEALASQVLSLPIHTEMSEDQLLYICDSIKAFPG